MQKGIKGIFRMGYKKKRKTTKTKVNHVCMNCVARQITLEIECKQWNVKSQTKDVHCTHTLLFYWESITTKCLHPACISIKWLMVEVDKDVCTFVTIYETFKCDNEEANKWRQIANCKCCYSLHELYSILGLSKYI